MKRVILTASLLAGFAVAAILLSGTPAQAAAIEVRVVVPQVVYPAYTPYRPSVPYSQRYYNYGYRPYVYQHTYPYGSPYVYRYSYPSPYRYYYYNRPVPRYQYRPQPGLRPHSRTKPQR